MKLNKKLKLRSSVLNRENVQELYLNYVSALIKTENLQNRLEQTCSNLISSPKCLVDKKTGNLNRNLNKLLVKIMLLQNTINYINLSDMS